MPSKSFTIGIEERADEGIGCLSGFLNDVVVKTLESLECFLFFPFMIRNAVLIPCRLKQPLCLLNDFLFRNNVTVTGFILILSHRN